MRHFLCSITRKYTYMHGMGWDLLSMCVMSVEVVGSWEHCSLAPFPSFRHLKMSPKFHLPLKSVLCILSSPITIFHPVSVASSLEGTVAAGTISEDLFWQNILMSILTCLTKKMSGFTCFGAFPKKHNLHALPGTFAGFLPFLPFSQAWRAYSVKSFWSFSLFAYKKGVPKKCLQNAVGAKVHLLNYL